jgi:hypothetical protein
MMSKRTKLTAIRDGKGIHVFGVVNSDNLIALLESIGGHMAKRRTKRKVSKTKTAAKRRAHGKGVYKVCGGWAVSRAKRHRKRAR